MSLLSTHGLTKRFGSVTAVDGLTVDVEPGVTGLVGANGAGKSTLLKILLGLIPPTDGSARVLDLDVTTDGSVAPKDAIAGAADILITQLAIFTDLEKLDLHEVAAAEAEVPTTSHGMENFPIEELELGVRSYNCLKRVGIETIGDLTSKSENELAAIPNFGRKSIEEVRETLAAHGLTLKGEELPA